MDFPAGWATFALALATVILALFAYLNLREMRKQTDLQLAPYLIVFLASPPPQVPVGKFMDIVVRNVGRGTVKRGDVKAVDKAGTPSSLGIVALEGGKEVRLRMPITLGTNTWDVEVTGVIDILDRPYPVKPIRLQYP